MPSAARRRVFERVLVAGQEPDSEHARHRLELVGERHRLRVKRAFRQVATRRFGPVVLLDRSGDFRGRLSRASRHDVP